MVGESFVNKVTRDKLMSRHNLNQRKKDEFFEPDLVIVPIKYSRKEHGTSSCCVGDGDVESDYEKKVRGIK